MFLPGDDDLRFLTRPTALGAWAAVIDGVIVGQVVLNGGTSPAVMDLVQSVRIERVDGDPTRRAMSGFNASVRSGRSASRPATHGTRPMRSTQGCPARNLRTGSIRSQMNIGRGSSFGGPDLNPQELGNTETMDVSDGASGSLGRLVTS